MSDTRYQKGILRVDVPHGRNPIVVELVGDGAILDSAEIEYEGPVDNRLLTVVDKMVHRNILDKFVSFDVEAGSGIDKNSLLYRIVLTLSAALERTR